MASHYILSIPRKIAFTALLLCTMPALIISQSVVMSPTQQVPHQHDHGCLIDLLLQQKKAANSNFAAKHNLMDRTIREHMQSGERSIITIPVVVHLIHDNGPELISYDQIVQGIEHLNLAFSNSGAYASADGVDTEIQFCLAQQDPNGMYTTGWTITQSPLTEMIAETQDVELKSLIQWDPNRYLNIWLVREITSFSMGDGIAGYAYFPSSQGQPEDGIVNEAGLFGSTVNNSKVHIHEAGHYLGLYHTFEGGCSNSDCMEDGDHVCDTPPDNSTASVICNNVANTCSSDADDTSTNNPFRPVNLGGLGDQPDMIENYMDYGYQACQTHFSAGQSDRMQAVMASERLILQSSDACTSPCPFQQPTTIVTNATTIEVGSALAFVASAPNAVSFTWLVNGIQQGTSDVFAYVFDTPGIYEIELISGYDGTPCTETTSLNIEVLCTAQASFTMASSNTYTLDTEVSAASTTTGGNNLQWYLDGQPVIGAATWSETFNTVGSHRIYLVAADQTCADTSHTYFFQVGNCSYSGVSANWSLQGKNLFFPESGAPYVSGPCPIAPGQISLECSSTISDAEGNLLFFTDGASVWDKNNNLMPNGTGLLGHWSSTQGSLIVPHPGNTNQYYVFVTDAAENYCALGLHYSIVDLTLNNGLGDVIESSKNTLLFENGTEKITATWHADGHSIWVASATRTSNAYYAYLIDGDGIHPDPVISHLGTTNASDLGCMKFSHDSNRMAAATISGWPWHVLVSDFNPSTGEFTNDFEITLSEFTNEQIYGVQFSPDNSKLYTTEVQGGELIQYDLTLTTPALIAASKYVVVNLLQGYGHIELGRDGIIYMPNLSWQALDAIQFPNMAGAACGFQNNLVPLGSLNMYAPWVLPNMLQGYQLPHNPSITGALNICADTDTYEYSIQFLSSTDAAIWSHTGPASFASNGNTCTLTTGNTTGTDILRVILNGSCGTTYDTLIVHTNLPGTDPLVNEIFWCNGSITLDPGDGYLSYNWMELSNSQQYEVNEPGEYWVEVKETTGCIISDTVQISPYPSLPAVSLGPDITICQGGVGILETSAVYPHYQWQNGMDTPTLTAYSPGLYWVTVSDDCGFTSTDDINVNMSIPQLDLNYNGEDTICSNILPVNVVAPTGFSLYEWSNGDNDATTTITSGGVYDLMAINASGCFARDTLWVLLCTDVNAFVGEELKIYPNPASELLYVEIPEGPNITFSVMNALGEQVYISNDNRSMRTTIDISQWADGMYTLRWNDLKTMANQKFMVLKGK